MIRFTAALFGWYEAGDGTVKNADFAEEFKGAFRWWKAFACSLAKLTS